MKNDIIILHASSGNQHCMINFKTYVFEFDQHDLATVIRNNNTIAELEALSDLDSEDYTATEMAHNIAGYFIHDDVELLIQEFIDNSPEKLIDHLQTCKN